uniref:Uncharacterized protein n=1 Tax=Anguilla anguilla TaxID=7936 RepID=A0A0E9XUY1_ANGAN
MSLDCGRKPEYPEETHTDTGRTCKLHTERIQTQDLLAGRRQCYPLHHRAAPSVFLFSQYINRLTLNYQATVPVISLYNHKVLGI